MKKIAIMAFVAMLSCSFSADAASSKRTPKRTSFKEWTLAVFLNADNNLDKYGAVDEIEMSQVGSNENLNIVTLIDRERDPAQINYVEKNKITKIKDMGEIDMGNYKEFVKFAKFVKENYPAKHYAFVFWNHGTGWKKKSEPGSMVKGISEDDSSGNHITTNQLTLATKEVQKIIGQNIDVLCFDACLMQMVEVAYAVKDSVDYLVASEENEPGKGAPYNDILKKVKKGMTPRDFVINWVEKYGDSYNDGSQGIAKSTQSALEMAKFPKFIDAVNGFAKVGMSKDYSRLFRVIYNFTQRFHFPENIDLLHFIELMQNDTTGILPPQAEPIKKATIDEPLRTAMTKLTAAGKELIIANRWTTDRCGNAKGIAIYFAPQWYVPSLYQDLGFAKDCLWDDMIIAQGGFENMSRVINDVRSGNMSSLKEITAASKKDPKNRTYRQILNKLNYIADSERSIPTRSMKEFETLRNKLKNNLTTSR